MTKTPKQPIRKETVVGTDYRYTALFEPAEEGGYVVLVPALNGLATQGETLEEARFMVRDAVIGYIEALREAGEEIPVEQPEAFTEPVDVTISRS